MEQWRRSGCVPDSDEEDELESQQTGIPGQGLDVIQDYVGGESSASQREERDGGSAGGIQLLQRNATPRPQVVIQVPSHHPSAAAPAVVDAADNLDRDPLQDDGNPGVRSPRSEGLDLSGEAPPNSHNNPEPSAAAENEPPSSPDELQFSQHLLPRQPITPIKRSPNDVLALQDSSLSSPLSSPPSNLESPRSLHVVSPSGAGGRDGDHGNPEIPPEDDAIVPLGGPPVSTSHGRALRPRNPTQINPFRIDIARYEKSCLDAGIAPERIRSFRRLYSSDVETTQKDRQDDESVLPSSSPSQSFRFPQSTPDPRKSHADTRMRHRRNLSDRAQSSRVYGEDASQPNPGFDIPATTNSYAAFKRRKLNHSGGGLGERKLGGKSPSTTVRSLAETADGTRTASYARNDSNIFDVPISPPPSDSPTTANTDKGHPVFRYPPDFNPPVLTPVTEQRPRHSARETETHVLVDSSPPSGVDRIPTVQYDNKVHSITDSSDDDALEIRDMRRRIKGVLPASWIRLDNKEQDKKAKTQAEKEKLRRARKDRQNGKGVAQRVSANRRAVNLRPTDFLPPEDSDTEDGNGPHAAVQRPALQTIDNPPGSNNDNDVPEDNHIYPMSPPTIRQPSNFSATASSRPKTSNTSSRPSGSSSRRGLRQSRITDSSTQKLTSRKPKLHIPRLGILDAPDVIKQPSQNQPQFLRVALRRARTCRNAGRSSPTGKVFKLANRRDTEDVNLALREWREGTIQPNGGNDRVTGRKRHHGSQYQPRLHRHFDREDDVQLTRQASEQQRSAVQAEHGPGESTNREASSTVETTFNDKGTGLSKQTRASNKQQQRRVIRKGYQLSSLRRNAPRPADLDYSDHSNAGPQPTSSFQQSLSALNASYRDARSRDFNQSLPLARFLSHTADNAETRRRSNDTSARNNDRPRQRNDQASGKVPRKRQPRRVNTDALEHRQFPGSQPDTTVPASVSFGDVTDSPLGSLQSVARTCSVDFQTSTLNPGTFYHESTFIGSGTFSRSLNISSRNMDVRNGQASIFYNGQTFYWNYWNEVVSSEVEMLFNNIIGSHSGASDQSTGTAFQAPELHQSLVCYINDNLSFMDGIDRRSFVAKGLKLLSKAAELPLFNRDQSNDSNHITGTGVRIEAFNLVFANQIRQIAAHEVVDRMQQENAMEGVMTFAGRVCSMITSDMGLRNIRLALDENNLREKREAGIREQYPFVEAYLIANHILYKQTALRSQLKDDPLSTALIGPIPSFWLSDAHRLEKVWSALFSIQPLQELDEFGILQSGLRFKGCVGQWQLVNQLAFKVLEWYESSRVTQRPYLNSYVRTLFVRCFCLIEHWGWHDCKPILETLFDFFAKNALHNLSNEETHGSPNFLDELDKISRICVDSRDSCFHVLLKVVAVGLRAMSKLHDKKFMRNLAWRLLPNHGRTYPKEEPLRQEDLDALRNHHDLLCALYSSTPLGCRPPLKTVRQLVHPASSHKEACSINIRAWLRLVSYKLSTKEEDSELEEFANWHSEFTSAILKQHSLARTEIESQNTSDGFITSRFVEHAISENQRQVESLISSSLVCLKGAISVTKDISQAKILIEKLPLERLLDLFDPRSRRLGEVLCQVLDVVVAYTSTASNLQPPEPPAAMDVSEDSQEYGDWTVFNEICDGTTQDLPPAISYVDNAIRPTLSRLVSRCFGEDRSPDDSVLLSVIHCWTSVILVLVNHGLREWKSYLNPYDGDSWLSLRTTDQTRRFTPHFLAVIVEKDFSAYRDCQPQLFSCWFASLVERGSMLKYQHRITNALLNADGMNNPLFKNLPFSMNKLSSRYEITLDEIGQRRVTLISCLLSNMRQHLFRVESQHMETVREQYVDMVKALMAAMKRNYEELGNTSEPVHGSYVEFVHRIVGFLQQHSQEICPIDSFFTDPKSFPLPASDPTYIVARLKSYGVRLTTAKAAKPLVSFIQGVSERAVLDDQQNYLVDQLYGATCDTSQEESYRSPTLRTFLLQCVYPAYVENSLTTPAAWLLVQPVLRSITRMFADLILNIDATNATAVCIVVDSIRVYFEAVDSSLQILIDHPGLLEEPSVLLTLSSFMETIIAALALIDYLDRKSGDATLLVAYIEYFQQFALFSISSLQDPASVTAPEPFDALLRKYGRAHINRWSTTPPSPPAYYAETRSFAACELRSWLQNGWSVHEGKYFVRQGPRSKEVHVSPSCKSADVARGAFVRTVEIFFGVIERLDAFEFLRI